MTSYYVLAGCAVVVLLLVRHFAPDVYDFAIVHMTQRWYAAVLADLNARVRGAPVTVLDVGVGTATALVRNREAIVGTKTRFVGVDYDAGYIIKGKAKVMEAGLSDQIELHYGSFFDAALLGRLLAENGDAEQFDAVYFSGSLTLLPSPLEALNVCRTVVKPGGLVYITQTFQKVGFPGLKFIKPLLWLFTTIDFGKLTYEAELEHLLARADGLAVLENDLVPGSINNRFQAARMVVLRVDQESNSTGAAVRRGGPAQSGNSTIARRR